MNGELPERADVLKVVDRLGIWLGHLGHSFRWSAVRLVLKSQVVETAAADEGSSTKVCSKFGGGGRQENEAGSIRSTDHEGEQSSGPFS